MWPKLKIVIAYRIGLKALFYQQIEQEAFVVSCFPWQPTTYWCETCRCNLQQHGWMLLEVTTSQVHWWILGFWPHFTAFGTNSLTKEILCDRNFFDLSHLTHVKIHLSAKNCRSRPTLQQQLPADTSWCLYLSLSASIHCIHQRVIFLVQFREQNIFFKINLRKMFR